jgi:hypothetical protein
VYIISASCFLAGCGIFMLKKNTDEWQGPEVSTVGRKCEEQPKLTELVGLVFKRN